MTRTLPELLLAESSESWGDERERAVMLEAYAYVFLLTQFVLWSVGAVLAWFVPVWVTVVLFVAFLAPSMEWQRYTRARGVDAYRLAYSGSSFRRTALIGAFSGCCAVSMAVAVAIQVAPDSSTTVGAIVGGICGGAAAIAFGRWHAKRRTNDDDLPDESVV